MFHLYSERTFSYNYIPLWTSTEAARTWDEYDMKYFCAKAKDHNYNTHRNNAIPKVHTAKKWVVWMNWKIEGLSKYNGLFYNGKLYSGIAVYLSCQSCGLTYLQSVILPLYNMGENVDYINRLVYQSIFCTYFETLRSWRCFTGIYKSWCEIPGRQNVVGKICLHIFAARLVCLKKYLPLHILPMYLLRHWIIDIFKGRYYTSYF